MKTEKEILQGILNIFNGGGDTYKPMQIGNIEFLRNNDYCAAIIKDSSLISVMQNIAHQLEFSEYLGAFNDIVIYKRPYEKMLNQKVDTKAHAKANNLKPATQFEDVKQHFESNENEEIKHFTQALYKRGFASYSDNFNNEMLKKFPNSNHPTIQTAKKMNELRTKRK